MHNIFSHLTEGGWNVAVRAAATGTILQDQTRVFTIIPDSWRSWSADPFIFENEGKSYIFAELFDYIKRRGSLGYTVLNQGKWSKWKPVIEEPFHMSYPNVFRHQAEIYMIPESSADHTLRLYKAVAFPDEWVLDRIIVDSVSWVDTTFFNQNGQIFAITTDISDEENHRDLLLSFTHNFELIQTTVIHEPHTELSRSGGNIFTFGEEVYRVTQDCSTHYGGGMIFSKFISESLESNGMEPETLHLFPDRVRTNLSHKWTGIHTYNSTEKLEVIDIERKHFNIFGIVSRLLSKF